MSILSLIFLAVATSAYIGWGLVGLLNRNQAHVPEGLTVSLGYALSQVLFFPAYFLFADAKPATIAVFGLATIFNIIYGCQYLTRYKDNSSSISSCIKRGYLPYLTGAIIIIFAALPYFYSGFGNYWHTANEDIIDGLNGRDAYLQNELIEKNKMPDPDARVRWSLAEQQLIEADLSKKINALAFRERYVHDPGRLQYSSLAFWSVVLNAPSGMDAFLIQALLNLGLFALGVFLVAERIFLLPRRAALAAALISVGSNFYFSTYLNGHEGSLMYNAVAPFLLYCFLQLIEKKRKPGIWLVIPSVFILFILGAYPYPLPYLAMPLLAYAVVGWLSVRSADKAGIYENTIRIIRRPQFIALALVVLIIGYGIAWVALEPMRFRAVSQYRSWGTMLNHVGILQFWGLWPSGLANIGTPLGWMDRRFILKVASLLFALILSGAAGYGFLRLFKHKVAFLVVWLPAWIAFFVLMRFIAYDSYYIYKFIYIYAWLIIIPTVAGIFSLINKRHSMLRLSGVTIMIVWLVANIVNNATAFIGISQKLYNYDYASYEKVGRIPEDMLAGTYIDIPFYDHGDVIRQVFASVSKVPQRSKAQAKYLLSMNGMTDILPETKTTPVWHNGNFALKPVPASDILEIATYWGPETEKNLVLASDILEIATHWKTETENTVASKKNRPFRWISDARNGYVVIDIHKRSQQAKYLYVCAESGPSVDYKIVDVRVTDADRRIVGTIGVGSYACHWLNIENYRAPFTLNHETRGKMISAVEQRKLIYRVLHVGVAQHPDDITALPQNAQNKDITFNLTVVPKGKIANPIILGCGWYPFEKYGGNDFRWVNRQAEMMIMNITRQGVLELEVEPGPSAVKPAITIMIQDDENRVLGQCVVKGRQRCSIPISSQKPGSLKLFLTSDGEGRSISSDPRILNFRVFNVAWKEGKTQ
jgi:hypothetical protein